MRSAGAALTVLSLAAAACAPPAPVDHGWLRGEVDHGATFVWIGAHPDDESILGGTLWASACRDHGDRCLLVAVTNGSGGSCTDESIRRGECPCPRGQIRCPVLLGRRRTEELARAAAVFHARSEVLDWDNHTTDRHFEDAVAAVTTLWQEAGADVVVTHGEKGGYGHPTHRWLSRVVRTAWSRADPATRPALCEALDLSWKGHDDETPTDTIEGDAPFAVARPAPAATLWDLALDALSKHATQTAYDDAKSEGADRHRATLHCTPGASARGAGR